MVVSRLHNQEYHGHAIKCLIDRGATKPKVTAEDRKNQVPHEFKVFCNNLTSDTTVEVIISISFVCNIVIICLHNNRIFDHFLNPLVQWSL